MNCVSRRTIAIIGAGPYGVSIAAHLQSAGLDFRIFGRPMDRWQCQMPKGMFLKSEGCASNLSDPTARYTLARYCAERGVPYGERGAPVSLEVFSQYALSFQRALAPNVEQVMVDKVDASGDGFELRLEDGTTMRATKVIVATGLEHTAHIPPALGGLPSELLSHSAGHYDLSKFKGRDVTVIGAGQSALEAAALLSEEGATVRLVVRNPSLAWNPMPRFVRRSLYERLRRPVSNLGQGLELWVCCTAPTLFHRLPQRIRFERVKTVLGPAGAWWLKDRVVGRVQTFLGHSVRRAEARGGRAVLQVAGQDGQVLDLTTDHVIAATGYRFDLQRLPFLSQNLKSGLRAKQQQPVLSSHFESTVPGLYFTGLASASCFGPAMRFLHGADFTARRVSHHIAAAQNQNGWESTFQCAPAPSCKEF
jgi:cation diffusion facilitator CzcD-associated flavoprotein CzcO